MYIQRGIFYEKKHKKNILFKIDFDTLERLYPDVDKDVGVCIGNKIIDFGKYKGKSYNEIKEDVAYLEWLVSIKKISIEELKVLTTE